MAEKFYLKEKSSPLKFREKTFRGIQEALEESHDTGRDLYELDDDEHNLLYKNDWDVETRRAVWRSLRASFGLSSMVRKALPPELAEGTFGPNFEVN